MAPTGASERRTMPVEAMIYYVPRAGDAERLIAEAHKAGIPPPLCIVTNGERRNECLGTVSEMMAAVAKHGRSLAEGPSGARLDWTLYRAGARWRQQATDFAP